MKKIKTAYWIITILFAGFMTFTAIPEILKVPDAVVFMRQLGYPDYFNRFIGVMKILGCIAILIPGYPRIKEWAYAGLAFDLLGAVFSLTASFGFEVSELFLLLPIVFLILSYSLYHKNLALQKAA
jgi:uncharacterized membrane protein YphA (DoxX/SURF4 family)